MSMSDTTLTPAPRVGSERIRLARLARDAALRVPGVVGTDSGPHGSFVTVGDGSPVEGVSCVAAGAGYEVGLRLICGLVGLPALADQVKAAVERAAALAQLPLDSVNVLVAELETGTAS
jgi:hypothetical protein